MAAAAVPTATSPDSKGPSLLYQKPIILDKEALIVFVGRLDIPRLSLSLETPVSSSPFPSPSSSFLPPPMPHAHEFAKTLPTNQFLKEKKKLADGEETAAPTSSSAAGSAPTPLPLTQSPPTISGGQTTPSISSPSGPSADPKTPTQSSRLSAPISIPSTRDSLVSTRPAPPSPAVSRRASAALSAHTHSRPTSTLLSRSPRPPSETPSNAPATAIPTTKPPHRHVPIVVVRDFAFPIGDERYEGRGAFVPKPNRRHAKRHSTLSTVSLSSNEDEEHSNFDDDDDEGGAGGWGSWGLSFRAWANAGPSQQDLNFGFTNPDEDEESSDAYADDDDDFDDDYGNSAEPVEIVPGVYRALYAFEPEGTAEMKLEEDQLVRIVGRGGGVGWAIAIRPAIEGGGHALVPESYLELVTADTNNLDSEIEAGSMETDINEDSKTTPSLGAGKTSGISAISK
jgi:hypothetical protein